MHLIPISKIIPTDLDLLRNLSEPEVPQRTAAAIKAYAKFTDQESTPVRLNELGRRLVRWID